MHLLVSELRRFQNARCNDKYLSVLFLFICGHDLGVDDRTFTHIAVVVRFDLMTHSSCCSFSIVSENIYVI